ncbi:hypothetical protein MRY87_05490 [bacterium]|nr:hypothetical protein [bacterium]
MSNPFSLHHFWKLEACGNTAVVMRAVSSQFSKDDVRTILSEEYGLGADNLLLYTTKGLPQGLDIVVDGYNADGSRVGLCGNGARCLSWLVEWQEELPSGPASTAGVGSRGAAFPRREMMMDDCRLSTEVKSLREGRVSLELSPPSFDPESVPYTGDASRFDFRFGGVTYDAVVVSTGNPHVVLFSDEEPTEEKMIELGLSLGGNVSLFPERVNVSLASVGEGSRVVARIYERGVGLSPSSGTGSVAIATAARSFLGVKSPLEVVMPGGSQVIEWEGGASPVISTTLVRLIAEGRYRPFESR